LKELWCLHPQDHAVQDDTGTTNFKVGTHPITQHYIPNDLTLQHHHYKNPEVKKLA